MFLVSLDILGFKSFADKTHIEFADGITALVGSNGCGKSNIVDAIKWVLGEQKSNSLRADKMEDVIFAGCETRKALNLAEVSLVIANEEGLLPREESQVEIKRRLYRSGESEYFINGEERKLKDVRALFLDTGVGKAAYSVMEQGKIDQAISSKPEERRYLFEEAAGITKFKVRSREAELKLRQTNENMAQADGILREVQHSYDTLKVQAEKTAKYRSLKEDVFNFERDIQLLRLKNFRDQKEERAETQKKRTAERDAVRAELEKTTQALADSMDLVNSLEAELVENQKKLIALAKEKEGLCAAARLMNEQKNECKNAIEDNEAQEARIKVKIEELQAEVDEQEAVVRDLQRKVGEVNTNITSFEQNIALSSSQITENDKSIHVKEDEITACEEARSKFEAELETITDDIVRELDAGLKNAGYSAGERAKKQAELGAALAKLETLLAGRTVLVEDLALAASRAQGGGALPPSAQELTQITESLRTSLNDAALLAGSAKKIFAEFCAVLPVFIDEFLSPQGIITKKRGIDAKIREAKETVLTKRGEIAALREQNHTLNEKINNYRQTLQELRVSRAKMAAQAEAAEEQSRLVKRELSGQMSLLKSVSDNLFLARKRLDEIRERISGTEEEIAGIEAAGTKLSADMEKLEKDIAHKNSELGGAESRIEKQREALNKANLALERIVMEIAQSGTEIKNLQDNFRETHSRDLLEFEARMYEITLPIPDLREKLSAARTALASLGSVNLMAVEEFAEVKERFEHLSTQMADLNKAKEDLEKIIAEIRAESSQKFMESYNKIKKNFHNMFRRLFGGGRAELLLSDPNHVLESGIEIFAQPPGKKLENITLLSGGEKSMTAVALLFATYMVKPAPFCLLDEIDAALDEANVGRFGQLLREFGKTSQFIVITHNRRTIICASSLLGVTMAEKGVTSMAAIKLRNEEEAARRQALAIDDDFVEEDVEIEEGRELPEGVNDPALVSKAELRPVTGG